MNRPTLIVFIVLVSLISPGFPLANAGYIYNSEEEPIGPEGACHRIIAACVDETGSCFKTINLEKENCRNAKRDPCVAAEASALHNGEWSQVKSHFHVTFSGQGYSGMDLIQCKPRD